MNPFWYELQQMKLWLFGEYRPEFECRVYKPNSLGYLVARTMHKIRHGN